jgi:hypothetical protein
LGNKLATSFVGLENENFIIGTSGGDLYTIAQSKSQSIPANCKNYTVLSSNVVRCDIC